MLILSFLLLSSGMTACSSRTYVGVPPPPQKAESRPAKPSGEAVWISGRWAWSGCEYVWDKGQWVEPEIGKSANSANWKKPAGTKKWVAGYWKKTPQGMVWIKGHWN